MLPILIIGQGLAGSTLAWELDRLKVDFHVVDRPIGATASRVAAGLVNPMMGKIFRAGWRQTECFDAATHFYPETEERLGGHWWQRVPIWRDLETDDQKEIWEERQYEETSCQWAGPILPWPKGWTGVGLAGYTTGSYVLHAEHLTNAIRQWLIETNRFTETNVCPEDIQETSEGILWQGNLYSKVVWATGWEVGKHPLMPALEGRPSKGLIIDLNLPGFNWEAGVLHYGHWLVKHDGFWRLGSTYTWAWNDEAEEQENALAALELLQSLAQHWTGTPEIIRYRSAVRPTIRRSDPIAGLIPGTQHQYVFSGLGTKGVTTSPWVAKTLANHLVQGAEIPDDISPNPLWKSYLRRHPELQPKNPKKHHHIPHSNHKSFEETNEQNK